MTGLLDLVHQLSQWNEIALDLREVNRLAKGLDGVIEIVAGHGDPSPKILP